MWHIRACLLFTVITVELQRSPCSAVTILTLFCKFGFVKWKNCSSCHADESSLKWNRPSGSRRRRRCCCCCSVFPHRHHYTLHHTFICLYFFITYLLSFFSLFQTCRTKSSRSSSQLLLIRSGSPILILGWVSPLRSADSSFSLVACRRQ